MFAQVAGGPHLTRNRLPNVLALTRRSAVLICLVHNLLCRSGEVKVRAASHLHLSTDIFADMSVLTSQEAADVRSAHDSFTSFRDACFQTIVGRNRVEAALFIASSYGLSLLLEASKDDLQALAQFNEQDESESTPDVKMTALDGFASVIWSAQVHIAAVRFLAVLTKWATGQVVHRARARACSRASSLRSFVGIVPGNDSADLDMKAAA